MTRIDSLDRGALDKFGLQTATFFSLQLRELPSLTSFLEGRTRRGLPYKSANNNRWSKILKKLNSKNPEKA
jgi:hypothetical protein